MDATSDTTDKPKLEELSHAQLIVLLKEAMERIKSLEKKLNDMLPPKLPVPYSVRSAEDRKKRQKELDRKNKEKKRCIPDFLRRSIAAKEPIHLGSRA